MNQTTPESQSQAAEILQRSLILRLSGLLSLFVALLVGTYVAVSSGVAAKEYDSLAVNLAGRQRMLTQRYASEISHALAAIHDSNTVMAIEMNLAASQTAELYEATLTALLEGGNVATSNEAKVALPAAQGKALIDQLGKAESQWRELRRLSELAIRANGTVSNKHRSGLDAQIERSLAEADRAVSLIQSQSEAKLRRVETYIGWACVLGVLLFAGTVAFVRARIVVPLADAMATLSRTNDGLEREIAKREASEALLLERESIIRSVLETAADGIITINENDIIESANDSAYKIFGYTAHTLVGKNVQILMPAAFREQHRFSLERYLRTGERKIIGSSREVVGLRKDGSVFPMQLSVGEAQLGERKIFSGIIRDLERERGKDERLGQLLKLFVDATDPIVISDLEGRILDLNDEAVRTYGFDREELLGKPINFLVPTENHRESDGLFERCRAGEVVRSVEVVRRTKAGEDIPMLLSLSLLTDEAGQPRGIAFYAKDISAQKELQAQLLQAQKLEAIGILAGGIAHDFNNLLTSIRGSSEILIDQLEPDGRLARSARRIQKAADRAASLTTRLLGFSRRQVTQHVTLDINSAVYEIRELFERTLPENIEFKTDLTDAALHVLADEGQFQQVLMNLLVNAADAMPKGGTLLLATAAREVGSDQAQMLDIPPGPCAALSVHDSGEGIAPEILTQIFDPFFTTKEVGKGTGLGLSTAIGIVREHGGVITVESEVGVGTTFCVLLPEVEARPSEAGKPNEAVVRAQAAGETILLVEDDPIMRDLLCEVLEEEGYAVMPAAEPLEALARSRDHGEEIAIVVTDVVMPNMSGFLLAKELRSQHPRIRVLYMSGYTEQVLADHGDFRDDDPFLRKPFGNDTLLAKVREVLDAEP